MNNKLAIPAFILITAIWGWTFPLLAVVVHHVSPAEFTSVRFALSAVILLPVFFLSFKSHSKTLFIGALLISICNVGIYLFQTIGLETVNPAASAFITNTSVVIIPVLARLLNISRLKMLDIIAVLICVVGLYVLTGANLTQISVGDVWTLACAFSFACSVLVMQWVSRRIKQYWLFTFYQIALTAIWSGLWVRHWHWAALIHGDILCTLLFCALLATVFTMFLQVRFQQSMTPTQAGLVFTLEPVFALLYSWLFFGMAVTDHLILGGMLILFSVVLDACRGYFRHSFFSKEL